MNDLAARRTPSELDARILSAIADWHAGGPGLDEAAFDSLALDLFAYQTATSHPYARFAHATLGRRRPAGWREIPAVPASAFKDAVLATFDPVSAALEFHTSGTTVSGTGRHYMERAALYDASLLAAFERFMLADGARLVYLSLVPDPRAHPRSSLGYMLARVGTQWGIAAPRFYLSGNAPLLVGFRADLEQAISAATPVCIAGTAFALVALVEACERENLAFVCPPGSRVMETGGFKGRSRVVARDVLYEQISACLGIGKQWIVAEYGMTELSSQYYDAPATRGAHVRLKVGPPWLRPIVVDAEGREAALGEVGFLRHVDLANRSSVIAVQTEDRGYATSEGFVLLGRDLDAPLRGCSLDAEELAAARRG